MDDSSEIPQLVSTVVALFAVFFAWLTFRFTRHDKQMERYETVKKTLNALREDLKVISEWARPYEKKSIKEYRVLKDGAYYKDWSRPYRQIFRFNYDAVKTTRQSPPSPDFDDQLLRNLAVLDHAIMNFFSLLGRFERIAQGNADLVRRVYLKTGTSTKRVEYTRDEQELRDIAFILNYGIHVNAIGGLTEADEKSPGLYWGYEQVRKDVVRIDRATIKPGLLTYEHKMYILGDIVAVMFLFGSVLYSYRLARLLWLTWVANDTLPSQLWWWFG